MGIAKRSLLAAATIAGASAIALGAGAGTAGAAYTTQCGGSNISGQGASLQYVAQTLWTADFRARVCTGLTVSYTRSSSGTGLNSWGADGRGRTPATSGYQYISTDDAPNSGQIANIRAAANSADVVVLPEIQAAIAIIANIPSGCTVSNISNRVLEETYRGVAHTWADLPGASGTCSASITPVVRADASGTTYNFKQYLYRINSGVVLGSPSRTWEDLQAIDTNIPVSNLTWPGTVTVAGGSGGGAVVTTVNATAGAIGYVNLADVGTTRTLNVQNRTSPTATYAAPADANGNANCANAVYSGIPSAVGGRYVNLDWSRVYGVNPAVGGGTYPICILTYEVKLAGNLPSRTGTSGYETARFAGTSAANNAIATSVYDYTAYQLSVAGTDGQNAAGASGRGYAVLPATVLAAARNAVAEIW